MLLWKHNSHGNLQWALHLNRITSQPQSFLSSFLLSYFNFWLYLCFSFYLFYFQFLLIKYFFPERLMNVVSWAPDSWKCPCHLFTWKTTWLGIIFGSCIFFPPDFVDIVPMSSSITVESFVPIWFLPTCDLIFLPRWTDESFISEAQLFHSDLS